MSDVQSSEHICNQVTLIPCTAEEHRLEIQGILILRRH